jgi:hypothetical protein
MTESGGNPASFAILFAILWRRVSYTAAAWCSPCWLCDCCAICGEVLDDCAVMCCCWTCCGGRGLLLDLWWGGDKGVRGGVGGWEGGLGGGRTVRLRGLRRWCEDGWCFGDNVSRILPAKKIQYYWYENSRLTRFSIMYFFFNKELLYSYKM